MAKVESFTLDHTKVKAPYVRLITVEEGAKGDKISNYDLRLVQPNENAIPTAGLHTIEHLLAGLLRDRLDKRQRLEVMDLRQLLLGPPLLIAVEQLLFAFHQQCLCPALTSFPFRQQIGQLEVR